MLDNAAADATQRGEAIGMKVIARASAQERQIAWLAPRWPVESGDWRAALPQRGPSEQPRGQTQGSRRGRCVDETSRLRVVTSPPSPSRRTQMAVITERSADNTAIRPFTIDIPEADLEDLRARIAATRWPEKETVADGSQGVQLAMLQALARYWAEEYDWRKCEAELNSVPNFITEIDGLCRPAVAGARRAVDPRGTRCARRLSRYRRARLVLHTPTNTDF